MSTLRKKKHEEHGGNFKWQFYLKSLGYFHHWETI